MTQATGAPLRLLATGTPAFGHLLPLLPLLRAAVRAGHDVRVATGSDLALELQRRGVQAYAAGPSWEQIAAGRDEAARRSSASSPHDELVLSAQHLFGGPAAERLPDLLALASDWRPDLVVHELLDLSGPMLARRLGVPSVTHGYGPPLPEYVAFGQVVADAAGEPDLWPSVRGRPYLDVCPPALGGDGPSPWAERWPLRPTAGERGADPLPADIARLLERRSGRPLVYVTLGTIANRGPGVLASIVRALATRQLDLVVTTGPGVDPRSLGGLPDHVAVAGFVPQAAILPHADVVVSQAGAGTMLGALCSGLPQVCVPLGADQPQNAASVARTGAAVVVTAEDRTPDRVRDAVERVVDDPRFGAAARRVRREIDALPSADVVVPRLEALARSRPA